MSVRLSLAVLLAAAIARAQPPASADYFERHVRPLLVVQCLDCHGAEGKKVKGGLRLTSRAELLKGGDGGPAVVVGDPAKSRLIQAVRHATDDLKMPPKGRLRDTEIAAMEAWIKAGAVWPEATGTRPRDGPLFTDEEKKFWAFQPIREPAVPPGGEARSAIDAFIRAKLRANGLAPARQADRHTLLRRVTYDLIGLPPTPAEIDAFVRDTSADAFAKVVDRLLESPHYGERWGRHWLDLARYADSNGLDENTAMANAWKYRDYVIRAFNADRPYDEFLREQIAGDLLPDASINPDRLTATGFLVLGAKLLAEPDKQKMKMDIADEQLDTIGRSILGLTLGCARCHDHKFDPLPTRDYYSLLAIFTSTRTMKNLSTVAQGHERPLPTGERPDVARERERKIAAQQAVVRKLTNELRGKIVREARANLADYLVATADARGREGVARMGNEKVRGAIVVEAERFRRGTADRSDMGFGEGIGIIISHQPEHKRAEYIVKVPRGGEYELEIRYAALESRPVKIEVDGKVVRNRVAARTTGGWNPEHQNWFPEGRLTLREGDNTIAIESIGTLPHIDKFALLPPLASTAGARQRLSAGTMAEVAQQRQLVFEFVAQWAEYVRQLSPNDPVFEPWLAVCDLPDADFEKSATPRLAKYRDRGLAVAPKSLGEFARTFAKYLADSPAGQKLLQNGPLQLKASLPSSPELLYPDEMMELAKADLALQVIQKTAPPINMVLAVEEGAKYPEVTADGRPRNLFVQMRGNPLMAGEEAPAVFPRILAGERQTAFVSLNSPPLPQEPNQTRYGSGRSASGRLEFANWIASRGNPLTARVLVNRVWQHHFGEGLVRTPDNFGKLGERPTHPELLDWLAVRFMGGGWSIKKLHRLILNSDTYQQASGPATEGDPENRLLAHISRRRLEAEAIRDGILAVAGTRDPKIGGSLVHNGNFNYVNHDPSVNALRYENTRRGVYLPIIRNNVFEFFQVFDFAEPHVANGKRVPTVVAPQALYLMNSPFVRDQARAFANRLGREAGDEAERIRRAHLLAYGRPASEDEVREGLDYMARYASALANEADGRQKAWQSYAHILLAASEFVYVN